RAAEYRDGATFEHTERVADLAARLATELGWAASQVELLRLAAPLHDIGKLAVADAVLLKAGKLTEEEFEQVKVHAEAGASILSDTRSDVLRMGREIARSHHEWWDGSGYPHGRSGTAIPEAGRIVALADVYDALTSPRPYKAAWTHEQARAELLRLSGRQFDPAVVEAFLRASENGFPEDPDTPRLPEREEAAALA
uniref:HD-GYP domain-containing protein n=1 Tax=Longimicrobium sp. TaxID=2029185 RepID=UPI003B3B28F3